MSKAGVKAIIKHIMRENIFMACIWPVFTEEQNKIKPLELRVRGKMCFNSRVPRDITR